MNSNQDKIKSNGKIVKHESAGGFVFYQSPNDGTLYVALVKKPDGGYFVPKGHIKHGETSKEAAIREVMEELSLKTRPKLLTKLGIDSYSFTLPNDHRKHQKKVYFYVYSLNSKVKISPLKEENFVKAKWLTYENALLKLKFDSNNLKKAKRLFLKTC